MHLVSNHFEIFPTADGRFPRKTLQTKLLVIYDFKNIQSLHQFENLLEHSHKKVVTVWPQMEKRTPNFNLLARQLAEKYIKSGLISIQTGYLVSEKHKHHLFSQITEIKEIFSQEKYCFTFLSDLYNFLEQITELKPDRYLLYSKSYSKTEFVNLIQDVSKIKLKVVTPPTLGEPVKLTLGSNYTLRDYYNSNYLLNQLKNPESPIERKMETIYKNFINTHSEYIYPNCFTNNKLFFTKQLYLIQYLNTYFDHVYVLNMLSRGDRWKRMQKQLKINNIFNPERFLGYDGNSEPFYSDWKKYTMLPLTADEKAIRRKGIKHPGSWGILKSMERMILDAKEKDYRRILVLQDDIIFHHDFIQQFYNFTNTVLTSDNWKLVYLGASQHIWEHVKYDLQQRYYHPNGYAEGAFAVLIDHSCYDDILSKISESCMPVDSGALCHIQRTYPDQCYVAYPNLIIADIRDSDIRHKRDFKSTGVLFKWDTNLYNIEL